MRYVKYLVKRSAPPSASGRNTGNTGHVTLPTPLGFLSRRCLERLQTRSGLTTAPQPSGESALVGAEARRAPYRLFRNGNSAGFFFFLCRNIYRPSLDRPSRRKREREKKVSRLKNGKQGGSHSHARLLPLRSEVNDWSRPNRGDLIRHITGGDTPGPFLLSPPPCAATVGSAVSSSFACHLRRSWITTRCAASAPRRHECTTTF